MTSRRSSSSAAWDVGLSLPDDLPLGAACGYFEMRVVDSVSCPCVEEGSKMRLRRRDMTSGAGHAATCVCVCARAGVLACACACVCVSVSLCLYVSVCVWNAENV